MVAKDVDKELKEVVWNHPDSKSSVRIREKNYAHFYKKKIINIAVWRLRTELPQALCLQRSRQLY